MYEAIVDNYPNEDREFTEFLIKNYEAVTKGSIWRGIDNIGRIVSNTSADFIGSEKSIEYLIKNEVPKKYFLNFIKKTTASDPNTVSTYRIIEDKKEIHFVETPELLRLEKDYIVYIDLDRSEYEIKDEYKNFINRKRDKAIKYKIGEKAEYTKKLVVFVSKNQYIEVEYAEKIKVSRIINFDKEIQPWTPTGVNIQKDGVCESPVNGYIPFGNIALLQRRMYVGVENIYGYPRMSEIHDSCPECRGYGDVKCDITDECPTGKTVCEPCNGTGYKTTQSVANIYQKRPNKDSGKYDATPAVEFYIPPVEIKQDSNNTWMDSIEKAEDQIYIQKKIKSGQPETAESKGITLEAMFTWLSRIGIEIYSNMNASVNGLLILENLEPIVIEQPKSYAILEETQAYEMFVQILESKAPQFIKGQQVELFVKRYISKTSQIHRIINILKKVDLFLFYTTEELQILSNTATINDNDWRIHNLAYPVLMQMMAENSDLFLLEDTEIVRQMQLRINPPMIGGQAKGDEQMSGLAATVGGAQALMIIIQNVASGIYDRTAAIELVSSLFSISKEKADAWLGTPGIDDVNVDDASKII